MCFNWHQDVSCCCNTDSAPPPSSHVHMWSVGTHITDDVPGGLGCHNRYGITSQVVAFLLCFFVGEFIQTLNWGKKQNQLHVDVHIQKRQTTKIIHQVLHGQVPVIMSLLRVLSFLRFWLQLRLKHDTYMEYGTFAFYFKTYVTLTIYRYYSWF